MHVLLDVVDASPGALRHGRVNGAGLGHLDEVVPPHVLENLKAAVLQELLLGGRDEAFRREAREGLFAFAADAADPGVDGAVRLVADRPDPVVPGGDLALPRVGQRPVALAGGPLQVRVVRQQNVVAADLVVPRDVLVGVQVPRRAQEAAWRDLDSFIKSCSRVPKSRNERK